MVPSVVAVGWCHCCSRFLAGDYSSHLWMLLMTVMMVGTEVEVGGCGENVGYV
jgi:hypothetical protein